jgi:hypothetical protein
MRLLITTLVLLYDLAKALGTQEHEVVTFWRKAW